MLLQSKLLHHKNELCDKRPFSCEYCGDYESTYNDVIHNHWPMCDYRPIQCPNECGAFLRQNIDGHIQEECPLTVIECQFHYAGCEVRFLRVDMQDHLNDCLIEHFSMLAVSHKRQQDKIQKHQEEIKALTEQIDKLKTQTKQLRSHT